MYKNDIKRSDSYRFGEYADGPKYEDKFNGNAYVDLGLPSGTLWAKMNVGASSETDVGLYFAWGETLGYTSEQVIGTDTPHKDFNWGDYKFGRDPLTKYTGEDGLTTLEAEDDAAFVNMGGNWHMPNEAQYLELFSKTTNGFITSDGTYTQYNWNDESSSLQPDTSVTTSTSAFNNTTGYIFFRKNVSLTDAIESNEYLFIPAAGRCDNNRVRGVNDWGNIWSSSLIDTYGIGVFSFDGGGANISAGIGRYSGLSVRGVINK